MSVPYWRSDRDYFARNDPRRAEHLAHIEVQERINRRIAVSSSEGDASYSVVVNKADCA